MLLRSARILIVLAVALGTFCWWGLFTTSGNKQFDEMAGMIPFFAGALAVIAALAAVILWFLARR